MAQERKIIYSQEAVNNAERIRNSVRDIQDHMKTSQAIQKDLGLSWKDINRDTNAVASSAAKFAKIQSEIVKSAKNQVKAEKESIKNRATAAQLEARITKLKKDQAENDRKILELEDKKDAASKAQLKTYKTQNFNIRQQVQYLGDAKDNSLLIAKDFQDLVDSSKKLNSKNSGFGMMAGVLEGMGSGFANFAQPFKDANEEARELSTIKEQLLQLEEDTLGMKLKSGKGMTLKKLQERGLTDITQGSSGKGAAKKIKEHKDGLMGKKSGMKPFGTAIKGLVKVAGKLLKALVLVKIAAGAIEFFEDVFFGAEKRSVEIAKQFGISKEQANSIRDNINKWASASGVASANVKSMTAALMSYNKIFKSNVQLSAEQLANMTFLTKRLGVSEDTAAHMTEKFIVYGETAKVASSNIYSMNEELRLSGKSISSFSSIMDTVAETSGFARIQFGGSSEALAKAAIASRRLGLSMQQQQSMADSLLDFESSMANELELELLLGKDINLEKARQMAADGNAAGAASEMLKVTGKSIAQLKKNPILFAATAKAIGLSRDELADMIYKQKSFAAQAEIMLQKEKELAAFIKSNNDLKKLSMEDYYKSTKEHMTNAELLAYENDENELARRAIMDKVLLRQQEAERKRLGLSKSTFDQAKLNITAGEAFAEAMEKVKAQLQALVGSGALDWLTKAIVGFTSRVADVGFGKALLGYGDENFLMKAQLKELAASKKKGEKITKEDLMRLGLDTEGFKDITKEILGKSRDDIANASDGFWNKVGAATIGAGVGSVVGGPTGAIVGGAVGLANREAAFNAQKQSKLDFYDAMSTVVPDEKDFILRPGQPPISFAKDDLLIGGTGLMKGGGRTEQLLERLIVAVEAGGDVYMDSNKVGNSLLLGASKMS